MFQEIDTYIDHASEQGYSAFLALGARVLAFVTNIVLTSAAKGQSTLAEHLSRSGIQDDGGETDSTSEAATVGTEAAGAGGEAGVDNGDPPRQRRRGRGRSSESADADESANEILRAAYQREVAPAGNDDHATRTTT